MAKAKKKAPTKPQAKRPAPSKAKPAAKSAARGNAAKKKPVAKKAVAKASAKKPVPKKSPLTQVKKVATKSKPAVAKKAPVTAASSKAVKKPERAVAAPKVSPLKPAAAAAPKALGNKTLPAAKPAAPKIAPPPKAAPATPPKPVAPVTEQVKTKTKVEPPRKLPTPVQQPPRNVAPAAEKAAIRKVINLDEIKLPAGYRPDPKEEYMSPLHLAYFRQKLDNWRQELITESQETLEHLRTETRDVGDEAERASRESDNILELRTRDRYRKLLHKIEEAIKRIEEGNYGYCEETGEEIGLGRLEARPIATLTVDAQERREMFQKQFRDDH